MWLHQNHARSYDIYYVLSHICHARSHDIYVLNHINHVRSHDIYIYTKSHMPCQITCHICTKQSQQPC